MAEEYSFTTQFRKYADEHLKLSEYIGEMKQPTAFFKLRSNGKLYNRKFWLDMGDLCIRYDNSQKLIWNSPQHIDLKDVKQILHGCKTEILQEAVRMKVVSNEDMCFSLIYGCDNKTLDLMATNKTAAETWINGLRYLIVSLKDFQQNNVNSGSDSVRSNSLQQDSGELLRSKEQCRDLNEVSKLDKPLTEKLQVEKEVPKSETVSEKISTANSVNFHSQTLSNDQIVSDDKGYPEKNIPVTNQAETLSVQTCLYPDLTSMQSIDTVDGSASNVSISLLDTSNSETLTLQETERPSHSVELSQDEAKLKEVPVKCHAEDTIIVEQVTNCIKQTESTSVQKSLHSNLPLIPLIDAVNVPSNLPMNSTSVLDTFKHEALIPQQIERSSHQAQISEDTVNLKEAIKEFDTLFTPEKGADDDQGSSIAKQSESLRTTTKHYSKTTSVLAHSVNTLKETNNMTLDLAAEK